MSYLKYTFLRGKQVTRKVRAWQRGTDIVDILPPGRRGGHGNGRAAKNGMEGRTQKKIEFTHRFTSVCLSVCSASLWLLWWENLWPKKRPHRFVPPTDVFTYIKHTHHLPSPVQYNTDQSITTYSYPSKNETFNHLARYSHNHNLNPCCHHPYSSPTR